MFRDTYKKAVDDIKPSKDALRITLSYIKEQQDRKKTIYFPIRSLASLVACAMIAFLGIRVYNNNNLQADSPIISQKTDVEESTTHNTPTMSSSSQADAKQSRGEDTNKISNIEIEAHNYSDVENNADNTNEITKPNARLIESQTATINSKNDNITTPPITTNNTQKFSYENYCKYIGLDIKEIVDLPMDLIFVDNNEIEIIDNIARFQWQGNEDRKITIYISNVENSINAIKQVPTKGQCIDKTVSKNNIHYHVNSENLTQDEFDRIINSIEKG